MGKRGIAQTKLLKQRSKEKRGGQARWEDNLDRSDSKMMSSLLKDYLEHLGLRNYTEATIRGREIALVWFLQWAQERELFFPEEVSSF